MKIDLLTSTVTLAGRRFPVCGVICPPHPDDPRPKRSDLLLGSRYGVHAISGISPSWHIVIPTENRVLISIEQYDNKDTMDVALWARTCALTKYPNPDLLWLPIDLFPAGGEILPGFHRWNGAEPDWVAGLIDRVTGYRYTEPEGPRVELIPYREAVALMIDDPAMVLDGKDQT